jgi:hypothetical protein
MPTVGAASSLVMVPTPSPSPSAAFDGELRVTLKVSLGSLTASPRTATVICCVVVPTAKESVPLAAA